MIHIDDISRRFGGVQALDRVSLEATRQQVVTVVGPSGCGKSTLLRIVAGLDTPDSGRICIDGSDITSIPPQRRNVAMVFQSYALYPNLTCYENIALNLRLKGLSAAEIDLRVAEISGALGIEDLLHRKPAALSGGQRQRVAVGRALVRKPSAFLLDEPLSNLDAQLRERVRHEMKTLFRSLDASVLYVTHDQTEALTLGDRIVVLNQGRIEQVGSPEEVYRHPRNRFVATFIGSPAMNVFEAVLDRGRLNLGGSVIQVPMDVTGVFDIGIRPEAIRLAAGSGACLSWIENLGADFLAGIRLHGPIELTLRTSQRPTRHECAVHVDAGAIHVFEKASGAAVSDHGARRTADVQPHPTSG